MQSIKTSLDSSILHQGFSSDKELIDTYHIQSGGSVEDCVNRTFEDLKQADISFEFFVVNKDNNFVGFFGSEKLGTINYLTTIFVKPEYRNSEDLKSFWS